MKESLKAKRMEVIRDDDSYELRVSDQEKHMAQRVSIYNYSSKPSHDQIQKETQLKNIDNGRFSNQLKRAAGQNLNEIEGHSQYMDDNSTNISNVMRKNKFEENQVRFPSQNFEIPQFQETFSESRAFQNDQNHKIYRQGPFAASKYVSAKQHDSNVQQVTTPVSNNEPKFQDPIAMRLALDNQRLQNYNDYEKSQRFQNHSQNHNFNGRRQKYPDFERQISNHQQKQRNYRNQNQFQPVQSMEERLMIYSNLNREAQIPRKIYSNQYEAAQANYDFHDDQKRFKQKYQNLINQNEQKYYIREDMNLNNIEYQRKRSKQKNSFHNQTLKNMNQRILQPLIENDENSVFQSSDRSSDSDSDLDNPNQNLNQQVPINDKDRHLSEVNHQISSQRYTISPIVDNQFNQTHKSGMISQNQQNNFKPSSQFIIKENDEMEQPKYDSSSHRTDLKRYSYPNQINSINIRTVKQQMKVNERDKRLNLRTPQTSRDHFKLKLKQRYSNLSPNQSKIMQPQNQKNQRRRKYQINIEDENELFYSAKRFTSSSPANKEKARDSEQNENLSSREDQQNDGDQNDVEWSNRNKKKVDEMRICSTQVNEAPLSDRDVVNKQQTLQKSNYSDHLPNEILSSGKISHAKSQQHINRKGISIDPSSERDLNVTKTFVGPDKYYKNQSKYLQYTTDGTKTIFVDQMPSQTRTVFEEFPNNTNNNIQVIESEDKQDQQESEILRFLQKNQGNDIENGEIIIDEFNCAIKLNILIQGKIYISNQALYFFSRFNDSILFFAKSTKFKLPFSQIKQVKKAKNAMIFDNSLEITLINDDVLFLTSFINRDQCYKLIKKVYLRQNTDLAEINKLFPKLQAESKVNTAFPSSHRSVNSSLNENMKHGVKSDDRRAKKSQEGQNRHSNVGRNIKSSTSDDSKKERNQKNKVTSQILQSDNQEFKSPETNTQAAINKNSQQSKFDSKSKELAKSISKKDQGKENQKEDENNQSKSGSNQNLNPNQINEDEKDSQDENQSDKGQEQQTVTDLWASSKQINTDFIQNQDYIKLEQERQKQIEKLIPNFKKGFSWKVYDQKIKGCSLKFMVQNYLYGRNKFDFDEHKQVSISDYFFKITEIDDISYDKKPQPQPGQENNALKYFMDYMMNLPSTSEIKDNWPLKEEAFQVNFANIPSNPHAMQPKRTTHEEFHTDYYVSPRKFIRYAYQNGLDFTYCDTFQLQTMITLTQLEGDSPEDFVTHVEIESRAETLKSVFMITNVILSQCEAQTKKAYSEMISPKFEGTIKSAITQFESSLQKHSNNKNENKKMKNNATQNDSDKQIEEKQIDEGDVNVEPDQAKDMRQGLQGNINGQASKELMQLIEKQEQTIDNLTKQTMVMQKSFSSEINSLKLSIQMLMAALIAIFMLILIQISYHGTLIKSIKIN